MRYLNPVSFACASVLLACSEPPPESIGNTPAPAVDGAQVSAIHPPQSEAPAPAVSPHPVSGTARYRERSDIGEQELGVPIYPGATRVTSGTWSLTDSLSEGAESLTSVRLRTADDIEKVAAFYRESLQFDSGQAFEFQGAKGKSFSFTTDAGGNRPSSNVVLRRDEQGTRIDISVMGVGSDKDS